MSLPDETKTDAQPSETADENDNSQNDDNQTVEDADANSSKGEGTDDEKQKGDSYYEEELKRLQAIEDEKKKLEDDLAEKNRQIEIKDRAIQAQKKRLSKDATIQDKDSLKKELLEEMRLERKVDSEIDAYSSNPKERELILKYYITGIVKTGDVAVDIRNAWALANAGRMKEILSQDQEMDMRDKASISSMNGENVRSAPGLTPIKSTLRKEVEKLVPKEARKYLDKYVPH